MMRVPLALSLPAGGAPPAPPAAHLPCLPPALMPTCHSKAAAQAHSLSLGRHCLVGIAGRACNQSCQMYGKLAWAATAATSTLSARRTKLPSSSASCIARQ